jgi:DinB superfamily
MKELLERIAGMPRFLDEAIEAAGAGEVDVPGAQDGFSLREQACHLRDLEREGYHVRVRRILAEDVPDLAGFDGGAIAKERNYRAQDARAAARDFAIARSQLVAMLTRATPAQLAREAMMFGKRITLADLVAMIDEHDQGHRAEIEALAPMESR